MGLGTGLVIGFAAGYYLGAKAGRERYHQIEDALETIKRSEGYRQLRAKVSEALEVAADTAPADGGDTESPTGAHLN